ncbi:ErmE/ErmH/ErmO/ErmR family 23S rRNA (adenine(2058)-N(6))-methyltransferase [Streptomyces griseorubiginosus]|uniref:ErmE/ErmH/ErmO/ErmR family 23S rRNA (adenine(2058)-N(6))-methyltransferase n=1 Tax=Streptomyces griseorubiginosus TaxID=67304 RepID=UPI0033DE1AB1
MARPTRVSRALSQNFLTDPRAAARLADIAVSDREALLLEVGAGKGALTEHLAPRCRRLLAYEIDDRLVPTLTARFSALPQVHVVAGDFLRARPPRTPFCVVGNVPFSRTSAVVDWCLRAPALTDATLLTQLEYARKRTGDYGSWTLLTVLSWPRYEWRLMGRVGRYSFRPVPRVDAGIVRIERRRTPLLAPASLPGWRRLLELGFSGVGGSLHASLRREHRRHRVDEAFRRAGLGRGALVGEVPPESWLRIHEVLAS